MRYDFQNFVKENEYNSWFVLHIKERRVLLDDETLKIFNSPKNTACRIKNYNENVNEIDQHKN